MQTLLQPWEVSKFTGMNVPSCDFRVIFGVEIAEFNSCLGRDFYNSLLAKLNPRDFCLWQSSKTYVVGDKVLFNNIVYKSLTVNTNKEPLGCNDDWEKQPKFNDACVENLWELYLGEYLSWVITRNRLPFLATQLTGSGLIKRFGEGFSAADNKDYNAIQASIARDIDRSFQNLDLFIKEDPTRECTKLYKGLEPIKYCSTCNKEEDNCGCDKSDTGYHYNFG